MSLTKRMLPVMLAVVLTLLSVGLVSAQVAGGTVSGTVTDTTNPIDGATVTVDGTTFSATTASDGTYSITGVTAGTYDVIASAAGYDPATQTGVKVSDTERADGVDVALQPITPPAPRW